MDADVEMIPFGREGSGIVAAEDLNMSLPMDFPEAKPRQGGRCVVVSFSLFIFAAIVLSGGVLFIRKSQIASNVRDQGRSRAHSKHDADKLEEEVRQWLAASVTLKDGIKYEVVRRLEHDPSAFTEGLTFANGVLYESTGMRGASSIRTLNATTGRVVKSYPLDRKYFGEGLTYANGKLYQLTYKKKTGFIFNETDLSKPIETFQFHTTTGEGWGLTYDSQRNEFIVSDGSKYLHFWDGDTLEQIRKVEVKRQNRRKSKNVNELEWWRGRILANVWFQDIILVIHPETGVVEKEYGTLHTLFPVHESRRRTFD